jgi:hypothetical protein
MKKPSARYRIQYVGIGPSIRKIAAEFDREEAARQKQEARRAKDKEKSARDE